MRIFNPDNYVEMPWKNGGGITTEIYQLSNPEGDFDLRLSVAKIKDDGAFSHFPGIDRHLLLLGGNGVTLLLPDQVKRLFVGSPPLSFKGEEDIQGQLISGEVSDFNVMVRRSWGKATVRESSNETLSCSSDLLLVYNCETRRLTELLRGEDLRLGPERSVIVTVDKL